MNLEKFAKLCGFNEIVASNVDDVVFKAKELGVKEIEVSQSVMNMIVCFYLSNSGDKDPDKPKILREGKIDCWFGLKVNLV